MDYEETMVDELDTEVEDIELPEEMIEEEEDNSESIDALEENPPAEEQPESKGTSEPGYVQKRIDRALARERDNIKAELKAEMEAQYAPIRERLFEMDAQELLRKGVVKDIDTARELVRYRNGVQPQQPVEQPAQPRQTNGQFAPKEDPATSARIDMLSHQADAIRAKTGVDVIDVFSKNEDIKQKIISGEMDFYDLAEQLKAQPKRKPPAPTRSPNGASGANHNAIDSMSDEMFDRLEKRIKEGARYSLK